MKKIIGFILLLTISFNSFSQANVEDINALSIFSEYVKAKNYDDAFQPWMELRQRSPKFNSAIYVYGERILKHKIKNSTVEEKEKIEEEAKPEEAELEVKDEEPKEEEGSSWLNIILYIIAAIGAIAAAAYFFMRRDPEPQTAADVGRQQSSQPEPEPTRTGISN